MASSSVYYDESPLEPLNEGSLYIETSGKSLFGFFQKDWQARAKISDHVRMLRGDVAFVVETHHDANVSLVLTRFGAVYVPFRGDKAWKELVTK